MTMLDQQDGVGGNVEIETEGLSGEDIVNQVVNRFSNDGRLSFEAATSSSGYGGSGAVGGTGSKVEGEKGDEEMESLIDNAIDASVVLVAGTFAITKLLTIDGRWIAQCYEGKPLFEFDRACMFQSGLVGFTLHGSLSHYHHQFCKTSWAAVWNSIYYAVVEAVRLDSPASNFSEFKAAFWPVLTACWELWPFAHLITCGVIPVEQRFLWVDCVELIWWTILST